MTDATAPEPRWRQRERIRSRGGRRRSGENAGAWRPDRDTPDDGCITGHPMLFEARASFELGRMPEGGGYPVGFVELAARLMGCNQLADVVHLCSGSVLARFTFDLRRASAAAVVADVRELPIRTGSVHWVMADRTMKPTPRRYGAPASTTRRRWSSSAKRPASSSRAAESPSSTT